MSGPLALLTRILGSEDNAVQVINELRRAGWLCVPITPTSKMVEDGWAAANEENAANTWRDMITSLLESGEGENQAQ